MRISSEVRRLIFRMVVENPTWGAPRIHGELPMLGFEEAAAGGGRAADYKSESGEHKATLERLHNSAHLNCVSAFSL
jgi:hypothetical protein